MVGGPHPTTSYQEVLDDKNIDVCAIGEGENTLSELVELLMNKKQFNYENLKKIPGIAFDEIKYPPSKKFASKTSKEKNINSSLHTT